MPRTEVWVDALFPGFRWTLPNGDEFSVDGDDIAYYQRRMSDMLAARAPIPACWEHQPSVGLSQDDRLAEQTKNTVGHCHASRIGPDGQLQIKVDADPDDVPRFRRIKFVSPEIRHNVVDTRTGHRWPGPSIVHLAFTPRPVQVTDEPHFSLSQARPVSLRHAAVPVSLSTASYAPPKGKPMPFPPKKDDAAPAETDTDLEDIGSEETPVPKPDADGAGDGDGGKNAAEAAAIHDLTTEMGTLGIQVHSSAGQDLLTFVQHVISALKATRRPRAGTTRTSRARPTRRRPARTNPSPKYRRPRP